MANTWRYILAALAGTLIIASLNAYDWELYEPYTPGKTATEAQIHEVYLERGSLSIIEIFPPQIIRGAPITPGILPEKRLVGSGKPGEWLKVSYEGKGIGQLKLDHGSVAGFPVPNEPSATVIVSIKQIDPDSSPQKPAFIIETSLIMP